MAINNVTSTLPDKPYIAALEAAVETLLANQARMQLDIQNLQRGR